MFTLRSCADKITAARPFSDFCDRLEGWAKLSPTVELLFFRQKLNMCFQCTHIGPKLTLFLVGAQLSRLISDFLYLCFVGLNWNSIIFASFCKYECFVLYFTDQIPIFSLVTKFKCSVPSLLPKFRFSVSFLSNFKCSVLLWAQRFKCSVLSLWTKFQCSVLSCGPTLNVLFSLGTKI